MGFALAGVITAAIAAVGYRSTGEVIDNTGRLTHTHEVRREAEQIASLMKDVETGTRGFAITGDDVFLEPFNRASTVVDGVAERLRAMTSDNPAQQKRIDNLRALVAEKLAVSRRTIAARRGGGLEAAVADVRTGDGKAAMDRLRAEVDAIDAEEQRLLTQRKRSTEEAADTATTIMLWGAVLGFLLVVALGWLITRSLSGQIGEAVRHVQTSSTELHAAASQQAAGSKEQATAMNEIATTITELLATSRQIAENAQRVAQIASDTAGSARTGTNVVDRAQESVTAIRRQVDQIVGHMLELGKSSQQIGSVLDIVGELAEQTNILAINATIEAAGAGDAGRRFAVVADEIRKLADRVSTSTKEIRTLIDTVRTSVNTTVMATETGSKAVDAGSKQFGDVAAAFRQIAGQVGTATDAAREIELSTKQQATAVEQVNVAIANVGQATRETEISSTQTLDTAAQLSRLSKDLLRVVQASA
ncbi:MAG TPA: CHASE3 domain-containing protein [Kofleriaceae bacterium]|nr:CHASE3 domain-containing protein [Kofleriaceae bacterium]